jgi:cbb3-type cytochrome oxidase maturation protein
MASLYLLIPIALLLLGVAVAAFLWAVDHGQFEDLESEGERILFEEDSRPERELEER